MRRKILIVCGTRPEVIKLAPLVRQAEQDSRIDVHFCVTAQHREMLDPLLTAFALTVHYDLNVMQPGQDLYQVTTKILDGMKHIYENFRPDLTIVQGDTTTAFAAALASFYERIPVGHVEAGLRTGNLYSPWPEEANRRFVSVISRYHYAPTARARANLLSEGEDPQKIIVTGNTVIDALQFIARRIDSEQPLRTSLESEFPYLSGRKLILVTAHRRENFGRGFESFCEALKRLAETRPDIVIVYPVHPNPNVQGPVHQRLDGVANIHLLRPLDYLPFVYLMKRAYLILTDSGGIQEEAPSFGKPVLVTRETTERPEAVDAGTAMLVGTDTDMIVTNVVRLLDDHSAYEQMAKAKNPFGDGKASERILKTWLQ